MTRGLKSTASLVLGALTLGFAGGAAAQVGGGSGVSAVSATPPSQAVTFNVFLPVQNRAALETLLSDQQTPSSPNFHKWLTPAQFNAQFGPTAAAVASATAALKAQGFTVVAAQGRAIRVAGTAGTVGRAFSTSLSTLQPRTGPAKLVANSPLVLPAALKSQGAMIAAFTGLPKMHTHFKLATQISSSKPANRYSSSGGYFFDDLKQAYGYPSYQAFDGTGVNAAVLISSDALDSDVAAEFNAGPLGFTIGGAPIQENFTGITGKPAPTLIHQPVDQATLNIDPNGVFEASLDVQQILGGAPGAKVTVVDVPDLSDQSLIDGYAYIVNATTASGKAQFQLVNSSFGECELFYTAPYNAGVDLTYLLDLYQVLFEQGNAEGITFVASSGDSGGLGCPDVNYVAPFFGKQPTAPSHFMPGIEFPASSPDVTAVGGGNLVTSYAPPSLASSYVDENAQGDPELPYDPYGLGSNAYGGFWGAGGGLSVLYPTPAYQKLVNTASPTYRTTPDVGMQVGGCPGGISITPCGPNRSYVIVAVETDPATNSGFYGLIGTSVSSPEFVGALALYVEKMGAGVGNVNTYLYKQAAAQNAGGPIVYNRAIPGFDGHFTNSFPSGGYDYLVGNGTPKVDSLFGLGAPLAGVPQTPSNP